MTVTRVVVAPSVTPSVPTRQAEPTVAPSPAPALVATLEPPDADEALAAIQQTIIPERDPFALAKAFGRIPLDAERRPVGGMPLYQVGDTELFTVANLTTSSRFTVTARLQYQSEHAHWWVQEGFNVAQSDLEKSAKIFDTQTYPTNHRFFGSEWSPGIDGDSRLHIFMGEVPGWGGYFSSTDENPRSVNPYSNEKEIFYINLEAARPGESIFDGTLAHEFQHMIHWHLDQNEDLWVNEGLSELAVKLNGFGIGSSPAAFARAPDRQLTQWDTASTENYGAAYLFMNYFLQRFGEETLRAVIQSPANGAAGFDEVLIPLGLSFDEVYADWLVANALDEPHVKGGIFSYSDRAASRPEPSARHSSFPVAESGTVNQYGADYITVEPPSGRSGDLTFNFNGSPRVGVLPVDAAEGDFLAWSNRSDSSHSHLTRAFDLSGLDNATLRFSAWYDLESGWDYAYVSVSTDGGERWTIVPSTSSTDHDPNGNAFGMGFTGRSGPGLVDLTDPEPARWIEERVDLTPFAGREVLVRFQMITDDAINRPGLAVDDIRIPELDYREGFEEGPGGWEHAGFVRTDNILPQRYLVQVITRGTEGPEIHRLELDAANRGEMTIPIAGSEAGHLLLIISGLTPVTSEVAPYRYRLDFEPQAP